MIKNSEQFLEDLNTLYQNFVDVRDELEDEVLPEADSDYKPELKDLLERIDKGLKTFRHFRKTASKALVNKSDGDPSPSQLANYKDEISTLLKSVDEIFAHIEGDIYTCYDDNPLEIGLSYADFIAMWSEQHNFFKTDIKSRLKIFLMKKY
jgi:hypothetical protein